MANGETSGHVPAAPEGATPSGEDPAVEAFNASMDEIIAADETPESEAFSPPPITEASVVPVEAPAASDVRAMESEEGVRRPSYEEVLGLLDRARRERRQLEEQLARSEEENNRLRQQVNDLARQFAESESQTERRIEDLENRHREEMAALREELRAALAGDGGAGGGGGHEDEDEDAVDDGAAEGGDGAAGGDGHEEGDGGGTAAGGGEDDGGAGAGEGGAGDGTDGGGGDHEGVGGGAAAENNPDEQGDEDDVGGGGETRNEEDEDEQQEEEFAGRGGQAGDGGNRANNGDNAGRNNHEQENNLGPSIGQMFRDRITPIIYRMDGQRGRVAEAEASSFLWFSRAPAIQRQYNNDVDRAVEDVIGSMERDPRVFNAILVRDPNTPNLRPGPQTIEYVGNTLRSMYGQMRREAYNISETMNGRAGDLRRSRNPRAFDHITNNRDGTLRRGTSNITGSDQGRYEGAPVGFDD